MYEGEVHYATWELKITMYLSSSYKKFCILAYVWIYRSCDDFKTS